MLSELCAEATSYSREWQPRECIDEGDSDLHLPEHLADVHIVSGMQETLDD
jgi:hypothetical protein